MYNQDISIIIVDDLQFSRVVVKTALKKAGYSGVRLADSASTALHMLEEQPADVVLADWVMPEMDGLELTNFIRQRDEEKGTYTSVILFTANEGVDYLVKAFENGVDDYLSKPPNPYELAARVNNAARIAIMQNDLLETSRQMRAMVSRLEAVSLTDPLTGVGNERLLKNQLDCHIREAAARNGGVSLVMLQIDYFDNIVDTHGQVVGDELLKNFTTRLQRIVRPIDMVTRVNDDRFAVIMHYTMIETFRASSMERVKNGLSQRPFVTSIGNVAITASIGMCFYRGDERLNTVESMIKCASDKLLTAQQQGKNVLVY